MPIQPTQSNLLGLFEVLLTYVEPFAIPIISATTISATSIYATTYYGLPTDVYVTGGTYSMGSAIFSNNTGGTFTVTGFATGSSSTDYYTTGATLIGSTVYFNRNDVLSAYTANLSPLTSFTNNNFVHITGDTMTGD